MEQSTFLWDRYSELEKLGEGGMGEVLKARDIGLEREVAIKRPRGGADEESLRRFLREARATGALEHPNIPPIYEMGKDEQGQPYFALKLIRGQSLAQLIERLRAGEPELHEQFPFQRRLRLFVKVCEAVAYAHDKGFVHRDIKPENIMVGEFGEVFLVDWGLVKEDSPERGPGETVEGQFAGTPMYAAPEQITGQSQGPSCDVYGLGATLYEWLSLETPFPKGNVRLLLADVLTKEPKDPVFFYHPVQGRIPVEMTRLVRKAMAKEPARRYASVRELLEAAQGLLDGEVAPICPCTTVKFGFHHVTQWIDNYPVLVFLVLAWLLYPLYSLLMFFWSRVSVSG